MKLVIIEPLGVEKEKLLALAEEKLEGKVEIVYYDTRVTDTETLIERAKDADILAFSNLPFKKEVLEHCDNLKMIPWLLRVWIMWLWITAGKEESW